MDLSTDLYKSGFFFLALGAILDLFILKWRENLWLWARVFLWERIDRLNIRNIHQKIASHILIPLKSKWFGDYGDGLILTLSALWSYLSSLLAHHNSEFSSIGYEVVKISGFIFYFLLFFFITHMLVGIFAKHESKIWGCLPNSLYPVARGILFSLLTAFVLGLIIIWVFGILFPPTPGWEVVVLSICTNVAFDGFSVYVTIKVLKWISSRGSLVSGVVGPMLDIISAGLFLFLSSAGIQFAFKGVGIDPVNYFSEFPKIYFSTMQISVFIPTLIIGFIIFGASLVKIVQASIKVVILHLIDISADPNDDKHVKPFTVIGAVSAIVLWSFNFFANPNQ